MPFTVSHVAAVLPLRGRWALPLSPLVLGSMAPDVWLFLGLSRLRDLAHSPLGVVTVDLAVVVVAGALWHHLLRAPVQALLPPLGARWPPALRTRRDPLWAVRWALAAVLGATTHVVWDLFTHGNPWVVQRLPFLDWSWLGQRSSVWLQYGSSLLGLLVVAAVAAHWWRATPPRYPPARVTASPTRVWVLTGLLVVTLAGAALRAEPVASLVVRTGAGLGPWRLRVLAQHLAIGAGVAMTVALLLGAIAWHVLDRRAAHARAAAEPAAQPAADPAAEPAADPAVAAPRQAP